LTRLGTLGRSFDFRFRGMRWFSLAAGPILPPVPQTKYARNGDVSIAYQVFGEGPFDVVLLLPWGSHVELAWDVPVMRALFERLSSFARVINFDKRGVGLSDKSSGFAAPETRMDDIRAVMDAAGSERAAIFGWSEGVQLALLFAASHPERAWALVACGGGLRPGGRRPKDDIVRAYAEQRVERERDPAGHAIAEARGGLSPSATDVEIAAFARMFRYAMSPGDEFAYGRMSAEGDTSHVLSAIAVPTLVLNHTDDHWVPVEFGRNLAAHIPTSTFVEVPIEGHVPSVASMGIFLDAIERFVKDAWASDTTREPDRVLATVLFTDIVGSTERMTELGDSGWRQLLERHHAAVRSELARSRGREIDTAGDGFFASFDGPARAVRCAKAIVDGVRELGIEVRSGLHTGECELVDGKIGGIAVHTGARVAAHAGPGEVLVSQTVKDLVAGSGLEFEDRGVQELKGVPGEWRLYAAV
jgi:class 3 adenylate cyclase